MLGMARVHVISKRNDHDDADEAGSAELLRATPTCGGGGVADLPASPNYRRGRGAPSAHACATPLLRQNF